MTTKADLDTGQRQAPRGLAIGPPEPADAAHWAALLRGYAASYGAAADDAQAVRLWAELNDAGLPLRALIARREGRAIGFALYVDLAHAVSGRRNGYLDDLYVEPAARGLGVGRALIEAVAAEGRRRGWVQLRWLADPANEPAIALYDRLAARRPRRVYQMDLASPGATAAAADARGCR